MHMMQFFDIIKKAFLLLWIIPLNKVFIKVGME